MFDYVQLTTKVLNAEHAGVKLVFQLHNPPPKIMTKQLTEKMCHVCWMSLLRQTGSRHMTDLRKGDAVQLTLIMVHTKYEIHGTYTS